MADFLKERTLNKDFEGFKRDLMEFTKAHFSGVFQDYNEASPGMALLELNAYIGDALAFYIDRSFSELKQDTARQYDNVVSFAKSVGYTPKGNRAARGKSYMLVELPATTNQNGEVIPDNTFAPVLRKGAELGGPNGTTFETLDNVHFSSSVGRQVTGSRFDSVTGQPTHFAVRKLVDITAGQTQTDVVTVGNFEQFKTIELENDNVLEIISVTDSDGNEWYEVDYLAQETIFDSAVNNEDDASEVPYTLKLLTVP